MRGCKPPLPLPLPPPLPPPLALHMHQPRQPRLREKKLARRGRRKRLPEEVSLALLNLALLLHAIAKIRKHCLHLISRPVASLQVPFRIPRTRASQLAPIRSRNRSLPGYHGRTLLSTLQRHAAKAKWPACTCRHLHMHTLLICAVRCHTGGAHRGRDECMPSQFDRHSKTLRAHG